MNILSSISSGSVLAGTQLQAISMEGIVLFLVNVLIIVVGAIVLKSTGRIIKQNDDDHKDLTASLEKIAASIETEREARHESFHQLDTRLWGMNSDLKENYQTRREGMRLYGTLVQKLDENHRVVVNKIDGLPCKEASCPGENKHA